MQSTSKCKIFSQKQPKVKNTIMNYFLSHFYGGDLDKIHLETQLLMVGPFCSELTNPSFKLKIFLRNLDLYHQLNKVHFSEVAT